MRDRRQQLARLVREVTDVQAETRLLVGRPATVLIEEVLRSNHDVVMRSHARELATSGPRPFGAVDMELLRKCPCPVLLVRHGQPATKPRIACAVDASADDPDAQGLNVKIVALALVMADLLESDLPTLFHAWAPFAERSVWRHTTEDQLLTLQTKRDVTPARRGAFGLYHFAVLLPEHSALGRFAAHLASLDLRVGMVAWARRLSRRGTTARMGIAGPL